MKFLGDIDTNTTILIDAKYNKVKTENGMEDFMTLVTKNVITNEKFINVIKEPKMDIYFTKPEFRNYDYYPSFMEINKLYPKTVPCKSVVREIAKEAGGSYETYYKSCIEKGNWGSMRNMHKYPYVLGSDYDPESYYRILWTLTYYNPNTPLNITKAYLDIETDGIDIIGVPTEGDCPINAVSIVDKTDKKVYVFLLRNPKNPLIAEFEENIDKFIDVCHESFDEKYGVLEYRIMMFDDEMIMIKAIFQLINQLKRDFLMIWNAEYDINYFYKRIAYLGYDPNEIMTHPDFPVREVKYVKDKHNFEIKNQKDYILMSSYTVVIDQMRTYAKLRKSGSELKSYNLNVVAKEELKDEKLDYSEEANIKTLPYVNYFKFVLYNIKDTLLQLGIDDKTSDTEDMFQKAYENSTPYKSVFSQTIFLSNLAYVFHIQNGFVIGNNINVDYDKKYSDTEVNKKKKIGFEGAVVGDPLLNDYEGTKILGKKSKYVYKNVIDMDRYCPLCG